MIRGFIGLIGSGKDTAADYLVNFHEFRKESFAGTLKDATAAVFGWDRTLLEGRTKQSRDWREKVDPWWSERLGIANLTPRWILQYWGTEVCRLGFHDDIWIASLENKMRQTSDNIVISDVRFPNEIKAIHNVGGIVVRITRGEDPHWFNDAVDMNAGDEQAKERIQELGIHSSETSWIGSKVEYIISNDSTVDALYQQIQELIKSPE
jgi:rhodanese-related sulfurtransferase